jgi:hypothetical protein
MKISPILASAVVALGFATGATSAGDVARPDSFRQIVATMNNVEWTIFQIGRVNDVSDVRLVQLDDAFGANQRAFVRALVAQQGTAQVDALRAAIAGNRRLLGELERQHIEYMHVVAVRIQNFRTITVYTFGASA